MLEEVSAEGEPGEARGLVPGGDPGATLKDEGLGGEGGRGGGREGWGLWT